jgi:hypothetical protein
MHSLKRIRPTVWKNGRVVQPGSRTFPKPLNENDCSLSPTGFTKQLWMGNTWSGTRSVSEAAVERRNAQKKGKRGLAEANTVRRTRVGASWTTPQRTLRELPRMKLIREKRQIEAGGL